MSGGDDRVWWRGVQLDRRTAAMMDEVARLVGATAPLHPSQGSWSGAQASAGTHAGCGAVDLTRATASQCQTIVAAARRVGFAAWHRTPQQSDWVRHCHLIAVQPGGKNDRGCLAASAHRQVIDYYENRNGLASGARDDGPRQFVGTTWESYTAANRPQPPPPPKRRRTTDMILIRADDSKSVALYGMTGLAGIANPDDLAQIRKALTDPAHTAVVSRGTWDMLAEAVRKP